MNITTPKGYFAVYQAWGDALGLDWFLGWGHTHFVCQYVLRIGEIA